MPDTTILAWPGGPSPISRSAVSTDPDEHLLERMGRGDMAAVAALALELGVDGHRADLAILETARTHAAWSNRTSLTTEDIRLAAELALPHRMRRQPFTEIRLEAAELVGALIPFDPDHLGAERAEDARADRTDEHAAEVGDADAGQRRCTPAHTTPNS